MTSASEAHDPLVRLQQISKNFGAVQALEDVTFEIGRGRVHALVGENGAGKSTLGKILGGALPFDHGTLVVEGEEVRYARPHDALADGIVIMQQEIALAPDLTVAENVLLGSEPRRFGMVRRRELRAAFDRVQAQTGFELNADDLVANLPLSKQQQVEILRAVARNARLIVMDEPTAALEASDARRLHDVVRALRDSGVTIVYVSHFLEEVLDLADDITIMRNGKHIGTQPAVGMTVESLIFGMLGRNLEGMFPDIPAPAAAAAPLLEVRALSVPDKVFDVDLTVAPGEVVGLYGLVGSGRSEIAHALFGALAGATYEAALAGERYHPQSPGEALRRGLCVLPESRKDQGLFLGMGQARNATMNVVRTFTRRGLLSRKSENAAATSALADVEVDRIDLAGVVSDLSGGNQQKVLLAKCLMVSPRLLILDEPTRGVDVGARRSIYDKVAEARRLRDGAHRHLIRHRRSDPAVTPRLRSAQRADHRRVHQQRRKP